MKSGQITLTSTLSLALLLGAPSFAIAQDEEGTAGYSATQMQPATPDMWDPARVEQSLEGLGFSDITDLTEQDGRWTFTARTQQTFDPATGQVSGMTGEQAQVTTGGQVGNYQATQMQPASPETWDPERLKSQLSELGYSQVGEVNQEGEQWQFSATREGEEQALSFNPQTGEIRDEANQVVDTLGSGSGYMATQRQPADTSMWDPASVEQNLEDLGYSEIGEIRQEGNQWSLSATKEGQAVDLVIDTRSGEIFTQERVGSLDQTAGADAEGNSQD